MPLKIVMVKGVRKVNIKIKTIATPMTFLDKYIWWDVVTITISMVSKLVIETAKAGRGGPLADGWVSKESFWVKTTIK
jgi:hypothetical protein